MADRWAHQDAYRAHRAGRHEFCHFLYCPERQELEYLADERDFVKAIFEVLDEMHITRKAFFGTSLAKAEAQANRELPDWLNREIDKVSRIQAHSQVMDSLAEGGLFNA